MYLPWRACSEIRDCGGELGPLLGTYLSYTDQEPQPPWDMCRNYSRNDTKALITMAGGKHSTETLLSVD